MTEISRGLTRTRPSTCDAASPPRFAEQSIQSIQHGYVHAQTSSLSSADAYLHDLLHVPLVYASARPAHWCQFKQHCLPELQ
jgi:hypothetical protein